MENEYMNNYLEEVASQEGYYPRYKPTYSLITEKWQEKKHNYLAPFTDKNGHELWSDDVVVNDAGTEMILRFGPYTAYDDDGVYDGWGWYLQVGVCNDDGILLLYQISPACRDLPEYITYVDSNALPKWYEQFLNLIKSHKAFTESVETTVSEVPDDK